MDFIAKPIFNLLTTIYALIPGHNFGLSIIVFTVLIRFLMYPMLKGQLKHTVAMRRMQPEIKKIKAKTKGDRQKEALMMGQLYREHKVRPMAFIGILVVQFLIFISLFYGIRRIVNDATQVYSHSYSVVQKLPQLQKVNQDSSVFDNTLVGVIDMSKPAYSEGVWYAPALLLVVASAFVQFLQTKQTLPKRSRKLKEILRDAAKEQKTADSSEVNAAVGQNMSYVMPIMVLVISMPFAAALPLYWLVSGLVAYLQQRKLLKKDEYSLEVATAEVVSKKPLQKPGKNRSPNSSSQRAESVEHITTTKSGVKISRVVKHSNANKHSSKTKKHTKKRRKK